MHYVCGIVATLLLAIACPAFSAPPAEKKTLILWSSFAGGKPRAAMDTFVRDFNERHAHLGQVKKLDLEAAQLEQKLLTAVAGDVPPDLVLFGRPYLAAYALRGAFEPWDPYLEELGLQESDFFEMLWREGIWEGKQYGIPMNTDVRVLFYNRTLFREAGLDPDRPPRSWDELRAMSRKLTKRRADGSLEQVGFVPMGGFGNTYLPLFMFQMGDDLLDDNGHLEINGPKSVAALAWVTDYMQEYDVEKLLILQSSSGTDELSLFLSGKMAMCGDEGYLLSIIRAHKPDLDFALAPLPWPKEGMHATWSGGYGWSLPRGKKLTPLGAAWIRYVTSREVQLEYGKIAEQVPALRAAAQDAYFMNDPDWKVFIEEMEHTRTLPISPLSKMMFYDLIKAREKAMFGQMTPKEALDWLQAELDAEWAKLTAYDAHPEFPWQVMAVSTTVIILVVLGIRLAFVIRKLRGMRLKRAEAIWGYLFAAPAILGLCGLALGPMLISVFISLCKYDVLSSPRFLGLENYHTLFASDPLFYKSLWNTLIYTGFAVPAGVVVSLALALLLNQNVWFRSLWRAVFYLPSIFPIVAGSFLWMWLFNGEFGLINSIVGLLGLEAIPWLTSTVWSKSALVIMSLWGVGGAMIIFLAALQSIPEYLYEAARIDGAGRVKRFLHITLPMISPSILFVFVIGTIGSFQVFTQAFLMTKGGPLDSTLFYVLYLFRQAFEYFHMGYASSMAWILFLIIGALTYLQFRLSRRYVHYE